MLNWDFKIASFLFGEQNMHLLNVQPICVDHTTADHLICIH